MASTIKKPAALLFLINYFLKIKLIKLILNILILGRSFMQTSKKILPYLGELFLLVLPFFMFSGHMLNSDEGHVLNDAWQMWNGQRMYLDFYQQVPPGAAVFVLSFWKLFGHASYLIAKTASIVFWIVSAHGIAQIVKQLRAAFSPRFSPCSPGCSQIFFIPSSIITTTVVLSPYGRPIFSCAPLKHSALSFISGAVF